MTVRMGNIDPGQGQETDQETDHIGDVVEADLAIVADAIADIEVEVGHVIVTVDTAEDKFLCVNNKLKLKKLMNSTPRLLLLNSQSRFFIQKYGF